MGKSYQVDPRSPSRFRKIRLVSNFLRMVVGSLMVLLLPILSFSADQTKPDRTFRIFHIMSFDSPWRWTDGQLAGFKEGLGQISAEYKVFQMDTKRHSSPGAKERKGQEARALIESWKPDLVYTSDDDALEYVTRHYLNSPLPFVFSGVNKDPQTHGIHNARNVTGVLEYEHFVESVKLLQALAPKAKRLALISDQAPHWPPVIDRIRSSLGQLPGTTLTVVDRVTSFEMFKTKMAHYPRIADAVLFLGIFNFVDQDGKNVPYQEVQKWTVQNSRLPDISFWIDRVHYGVLASVTVSEREQGLAAGRLARAILVEGRSPSSLPIRPTVKGHPAINLVRARQLGIQVKSSLLLSSEVVTDFEWERTRP
jgi:ABC-type uncharacterized transport system substrate-binding protein